jgi:hypothetical protein
MKATGIMALAVGIGLMAGMFGKSNTSTPTPTPEEPHTSPGPSGGNTLIPDGAEWVKLHPGSTPADADYYVLMHPSGSAEVDNYHRQYYVYFVYYWGGTWR